MLAEGGAGQGAATTDDLVTVNIEVPAAVDVRVTHQRGAGLMARIDQALIDQSLDAAAQQHFIHLFTVLQLADAGGLDKFERGLRKLIDSYDKVGDLMIQLKDELLVAEPM